MHCPFGDRSKREERKHMFLRVPKQVSEREGQESTGWPCCKEAVGRSASARQPCGTGVPSWRRRDCGEPVNCEQQSIRG